MKRSTERRRAACRLPPLAGWRQGLAPMRKGQAGHLTAVPRATSLAWPAQQSRQRARWACSGLMGSWPASLNSSCVISRGSLPTGLPWCSLRPGFTYATTWPETPGFASSRRRHSAADSLLIPYRRNEAGPMGRVSKAEKPIETLLSKPPSSREGPRVRRLAGGARRIRTCMGLFLSSGCFGFC
jgi:hypothetical protein